jgi:MFS family permease
VFRVAVVVFSLAGFLAGTATSMPAMIGIRLVQGAGSGLVFAAGLAAVGLVFPPGLTGRAFAANSTVWGVMGAAAPAIAAFMLTVASWRWIFFINLPLGAVAMVAGLRALPGPVGGRHKVTTDWLGAGLVATFTLAALVAIDTLALASLAWAGLAVVAAVAFVAHARRASDPIIRPEHLIRQPYSGMALSVTALITAAFGANVYLTLYVSAGRGVGPTGTAWSVFFFIIGWTIGANLSSRLLDRLAESTVMVIGSCCTIPGLAVAAVTVVADGPLAVVLGGLLVAGMGLGLSTNAALTLLRATTPASQIGRAAAAHQFMRSQGFTLGSAMGGAVLLLVVGGRLGSVEPVRRLLAGEAGGVGDTISVAVRSGYSATLVMSSVVAVLAIVPIVTLRRHLAPAREAARG